MKTSDAILHKFKELAEDARQAARETSDLISKVTLFSIADDYERVAERLEMLAVIDSLN